MDGFLDCRTCGQNFNLDRRRPKLLPCGHTECLTCATIGQRSSGGVICLVDQQSFYVEAARLPDDYQLVIWLEAMTEGVLECMHCKKPFDRLFRRPTALDCGHTACRVCLLPPRSARSRSALEKPSWRRDSVDESWDFSQEDYYTDSEGSGSSLPSDGDLLDEPLVDCPIEGCGKNVGIQDHKHVVACLDGTVATSRVRGAGDELLTKLARLGGKLEDRLALLKRMLGPDADPMSTEIHMKAGKDVLMSALRWIVEHQDSPRSEQPVVFSQIHALPDVVAEAKEELAGIHESGWSRDVTAVTSLKKCKVELDVFDLAQNVPGEMRVKKEALLRSDDRVWKLTGVDCWFDPEWTLRLLRRVAPDVEQLQLRYPTREHLQVVRDAMPFLTRLEVRGWMGSDLMYEPFDFDEAPVRNHDTLEWLEVFLPTPTALSLLRTHRRTIRTLRILVADEWGLPADPSASGSGTQEGGLLSEEDEDGFCVVPFAEDVRLSHCVDDLPEACGVGAAECSQPLSSIKLTWPSTLHHDSWRCNKLARTLHDANPHVGIECELCPR